MTKQEKHTYWKEIDIIRKFRRYNIFYKELDKEQDLFNHYEKSEYDSCIICLNNTIEEFMKSTGYDREKSLELLRKLSGIKY